jgi:hypothetical protein
LQRKIAIRKAVLQWSPSLISRWPRRRRLQRQSSNRSTSKMPSPDGVQRLEQIWMITYVDSGGRETVAQAKLTSGDFAPLIAADAARLESLMPVARGIEGEPGKAATR